MGAAAANPGSSASEGIGLGIGLAMGKKMGDALDSGPSNREKDTNTPPTIPPERTYYVAAEGHQTGPFTIREVGSKIRRSDLARETLVWTQGMESWQPASELAELQAYFDQVPPTLPGTPPGG
jgi:hypothetical protein